MSDPEARVQFLGIDTGGTFTDFLAQFEDGRYRTGKVPTTPEDPSLGVRRILGELPLDEECLLVHGTTVATNALLERELPDWLLVTNQGLEGLLTIGRGTRRELYNLNPDPSDYVYQDADVVGAPIRSHPFEEEEQPLVLGEQQARDLRETIRDRDPDVTAVCLVHSYRNPDAERRIRQALDALDVKVVLSSDVLPRFREFERASTTVVNAALQPIVSRYVNRIRRDPEGPRKLRVMSSDRGLIDSEETIQRPVLTVLSGPAGGMKAAQCFARDVDETSLISLDIGGTSTDVSLIEGSIPLRDNHEIGGFPIAQPMVDLHTVGSGGGSVLWVDEGGHLRVGPRSAGADPGPACYQQGGPATVTDAQLFMGRIPEDRSLSNQLDLSAEKARQALAKVGQTLGYSVRQTARGALRIVRSQLGEAIRKVTLQRGKNPSRYPLVAFGGGGGLYGAQVADELGIERVLIPRQAGIASAWGLLEAPRVTQRTISPLQVLDEPGAPLPGRNELLGKAPSWSGAETSLDLEAECQFQGQTHTQRIPVAEDMTQGELVEEFGRLYRETYGYEPSEESVEMVHLSAFWHESLPVPERVAGDRGELRNTETQLVDTGKEQIEVPHHDLENMARSLRGPALLSGSTTTVYVPDGWRVIPRERVVDLQSHG